MMKHDNPKGKWTIPFFLVLAVMTVVSFLLPLRPTQSEMEKRDLAKFPEFSVDALVSGSYFDEITLWFSDTFPGREGWLSLSSFTQSFQGYSEITIEGGPAQLETVPPVSEVPDPEAAVSPITEPREQETAQTEPETQPTEPREWGGVDAADDENILFGGSIIQIGDSMFSALGFSQRESDHYIQILNDFVEAVDGTGATVISAPPPTAVGILVEEAFQAKLRSVSQDETLGYLHAGMDERIVKVDTVNALLPHNSEYIYFRTDHHWTALGAYYSYRAVCEAIGMEPVEIETMEVWDQGEFIGSMYGRSRNPHKLKKDNVYAYVPQGDITATAYSKEGNGREIPILADTTHRGKNAKYLVFGTDYSLNHVQNRSLPDGPNVLVIKDSFGNCFVPFLTQNFHNIYAVDYRKFRNIPLTEFVAEYDIDYVIFMPYLTATQSGQGTELIRNLCF